MNLCKLSKEISTARQSDCNKNLFGKMSTMFYYGHLLVSTLANFANAS